MENQGPNIPQPERFFKIRRRSDGLYVNNRGNFNKRGRIWRNLSALRNHMNYITGSKYDDCDIIEFVSVEVEITPAVNEVNAAANRKLEKKQSYIKKQAEYKKQVEVAQLKELKAKYPDV